MEALNNSYLHTLVDRFEQSNADPLTSIFVFPSLRSASEFKSAFAHSHQSTLLPECLSISQLLNRLTDQQYAGSFESSAAIKIAVKKILPKLPEEFVEHASSMLLSDINELVMFELDIEEVFRHAAEIYNIDRWGSSDDEHAFHENYESLCRNVNLIKDEFEAILKTRDQFPSYQRYDHLTRQDEVLSNYDEIWFCGFAVLNPKEQTFIKNIGKYCQTSFSWKIHDWYINEETNQAGRFYRELPNSFKVQEEALPFNDPQIYYAGYSSNAEAQLSIVKQLKLDIASDPMDYRYGIILGDESQLLSLMHFVESFGEQVNVSASLPVEYSPLIKDVLSQSREKFNREDSVEKRLKWLEGFMTNWKPKTGSTSMLALVEEQRNMLLTQLEFIREDKLILSEVLGSWIQFRSWIGQLKINVKGNRESRIQVFGLLESRTLDFDRLYFLNWNEGNFQGKVRFDSLIPFTTRNEYQLPMSEEKESVFSYYFFSLISSCRSAVLSYIDSSAFGAGEKSRLLQQIIYEAQFSKTKELKQDQKIAPLKESFIKRDASFEEEFKAFISKGISASAINLFARDPFEFYYRHLWEIEEIRKVDLHEDSSLLGNVVHECLELIYQPYINELIDENTLNQIIKSWKNDFQTIILGTKDVKRLGVPPYLLNHISKAIELYLKADLSRVIDHGAFTLLDLEKRFEVQLSLKDGTPFCIKGTIDRIERSGEEIRIIDYKTGKVDARFLKFSQKAHEELWSSDKYDKLRQLLIYFYLLRSSDDSLKDFDFKLIIDKLLYGSPQRIEMTFEPDFDLPDEKQIEQDLINWIEHVLREVEEFELRA